MANSYGYYDILSPVSKNMFEKNEYVFIGWHVYSSTYNDYIGTDGLWHEFSSNFNRKYLADEDFLYYPTEDYPKDEYGVYLIANWAPEDTKKGDVNLNGELDDDDLIMLEDYANGMRGLTSNQWYAADFDRNGVVDYNDYIYLHNYMNT